MTEATQVQTKPPRKGKVIGVQGPVVDVMFNTVEEMPDLNEVVRARTFDKKEVKLLAAEHLEGNIARCIALSSTQNLQRNSSAMAEGQALTIPVGKDCQTCDVCGSPWGTLHEHTPFGVARPHWACCHSPYANHPHGPPCCEYLGDALDEFPDREVAIRVARERRERVVQAWKEGKS